MAFSCKWFCRLYCAHAHRDAARPEDTPSAAGGGGGIMTPPMGAIDAESGGATAAMLLVRSSAATAAMKPRGVGSRGRGPEKTRGDARENAA